MYEKYYGFSERPFALLPDPEFLYLSKDHGMALTLLRYSLMNKQGFTVITGEVGAGKTTLINRLLSEMGDDLTVGLINFTHNSFGELSEWVLMAFGLEYKNKSKVEIYEDFVNFLISEYSQGRRVVLVIDEAQNMEPKVLEEVRMLSNVNAKKDYLLQLILVGQPELRAMLQRPELRQLTQRVSVYYHVGALSLVESKAYIKHRLKCVGGAPDLFAEKAVELIWGASKGVPRIINTLCDLALVYGYSAGRPQITEETANEVLADRRKMSLLPADGPALDAKPGLTAVAGPSEKYSGD
jgi:general secretion pathway protein A